MSLASASTIAQILPALLVVGLLGPIFLGWKMQSPERLYFASQTTLALLSEAILLWFIVRDEDVPAGLSTFVQGSLFLSLIGILVVVWAWARSRPSERKAEQEAYERSRKRKGRDKDDV
ncbi:hypothetical protein [Agromyces bauzanensis]|uniref:Uncharacterized protein n=1 Tax=Agromyces bauzanensis TaxID=1308924 RepID=A0A917PLK2_9MICO|nr:hypothetical protein [Agromyces bauzanensis]GGJ83130.1 hypothetical protein GCM10011372_21790 [Agromyces bauzanensis]